MLCDIFCRVIDNYGDIGVCWRLAADLAARGQQLRLWVDEPSALQWMAPGALQGSWPGVAVLKWTQAQLPENLQSLPAADVWIEAFGCELPAEFVAHFAQRLPPGSAPPVWLNLEYLSAESYVERCHALPSPVMQGPARGWTKHFFYPGFGAATGGLLRETDLLPPLQHEASQPRQVDVPLRISLFCYEPPALRPLLEQFMASPRPVELQVTAGRAAKAVRRHMGEATARGALQLNHLPHLSQTAYDQLLQRCDLNFVRGEDSLVRAIWAGKPFVWNIYAQDDQAHHDKLEAFLQRLQFSDAVCGLHRIWNQLEPLPSGTSGFLALGQAELQQWRNEVEAARAQLLAWPDLSSQLLEFVLKNR